MSAAGRRSRRPLKPTVFVVDDDPAVLGSLSYLLRSEGFLVKAHRSATRFLASDDASEHGCVVLDLRMPDMDGMEALERIRAAHRERPVILVSGDLDSPSVDAARERGAFAMLEKPFDHDELVAHVQRALADQD